jgi:hypothetical protein
MASYSALLNLIFVSTTVGLLVAQIEGDGLLRSGAVYQKKNSYSQV